MHYYITNRYIIIFMQKSLISFLFESHTTNINELITALD